MKTPQAVSVLTERAVRLSRSIRERWNSIDRAKLSVTLFMVLVLFTSAALVVPILPAYYLSWYEEELRDQIAITQKRIDSRASSLAMYKELQETSKKVFELTSVLEQVDKQRTIPLQFYRAFVKKIHEDLWFSSIKYKRGAVTLDVLANDKGSIDRYVEKLGRTAQISAVKAESIQQLDLPSFKGCSAKITFRWTAE